MFEDKDQNQNESADEKEFDAVSEMDVDLENTISLTDEETGEEIEFIVDDTFEMNGKEYIVLLKPTDDPDADYEYVIMENVVIDGEEMLQTVTGKEADVIYDYYDQLCDELYGDDEESDK